MDFFFIFLKVEKVSKMHWKDFGQWGMVRCMLNLVLVITKHMVQKAKFFPFIVMRSQLSLTKGKFQSIGCPYFWIYKLSLKEVSLTTWLSCWWILSTLFWDYLMGIGIQVGLLWYGWCDFILEFEDRGDSVAHDKTSLICH